MPTNSTKFGSNLQDMVYLLSESEARAELGEAFASIVSNPTVVWTKFILTDDMRNGNGQRIPREEFANLIKTGIHMPVKMAKGEISRGHAGTEPLGSITHLKVVTLPDGSEAVMALAALWGEERPADVQYIKQQFAEKKPVDISWEILYEDASYNVDHNSIDLFGTVLRAATVVGEPAYEGRTRVLSVAARKWSKAYVSELPKTSFLYVDGEERLFPIIDEEGKIDRTRLKDALAELQMSGVSEETKKAKTEVVKTLIEKFEAGASIEEVTSLFLSNPDLTEEALKNIEELEAQVAEMEPKLTDALAQLEAKETLLAEKENAIAELTEKLNAIEPELQTLRDFKAEIEAEAAKIEKMDAIKSKFTEAGIEKDDQYFTENFEKFAGMDESLLEFFIQEMAANLSSEAAKQSSTASKNTTKIPALTGSEGSDTSVKALAQYLREQTGKK